MNMQYYIRINVRTPDGMKEIGNFLLGESREFAENTFENLKKDTSAERPLLRIDLIKGSDPVATCIRSIPCTLEQYTENCKLITRDIFKYLAIERGVFT